MMVRFNKGMLFDICRSVNLGLRGNGGGWCDYLWMFGNRVVGWGFPLLGCGFLFISCGGFPRDGLGLGGGCGVGCAPWRFEPVLERGDADCLGNLRQLHFACVVAQYVALSFPVQGEAMIGECG